MHSALQADQDFRPIGSVTGSSDGSLTFRYHAPGDEPDTPDAAKSARAAATGHEGDAERLHAYWTRGEGLAKWSKSPHPFTALYHHLLRHIENVAEAKATAAKWYHDVFHSWPGQHHGGHS